MGNIIAISLRAINIVTIAAAKELTDIGLLRSIDRFSVSLHLGRDSDEGIPIFGNLVVARLRQLFRQYFRRGFSL